MSQTKLWIKRRFRRFFLSNATPMWTAIQSSGLFGFLQARNRTWRTKGGWAYPYMGPAPHRCLTKPCSSQEKKKWSKQRSRWHSHPANNACLESRDLKEINWNPSSCSSHCEFASSSLRNSLGLASPTVGLHRFWIILLWFITVHISGLLDKEDVPILGSYLTFQKMKLLNECLKENLFYRNF